MPIPPRERSGSPLVWQILSGVLAIVAVVAVIVTVTNHDNGSQWKSRATKAETLASQMQAKLTKSEETSTSLQKRTVELAAEKAEAEDNAMVRSLDADFTESVSDQLDTCSAGIDELFDEIAAAASFEELQAYGDEADTVYNQCLAAGEAASQLSQYLRDESDS